METKEPHPGQREKEVQAVVKEDKVVARADREVASEDRGVAREDRGVVALVAVAVVVTDHAGLIHSPNPPTRLRH